MTRTPAGRRPGCRPIVDSLLALGLHRRWPQSLGTSRGPSSPRFLHDWGQLVQIREHFGDPCGLENRRPIGAIRQKCHAVSHLRAFRRRVRIPAPGQTERKRRHPAGACPFSRRQVGETPLALSGRPDARLSSRCRHHPVAKVVPDNQPAGTLTPYRGCSPRATRSPRKRDRHADRWFWGKVPASTPSDWR